MFLFKLALKNLLRARRRTILTFLVLSFGVAVYIMMTSLMAGFDRTSNHNIINFETGHFKIRSADFDEDRPFDLKNATVDPALGGRASLPFVTGAAPRLNFTAELDNGQDATPVVAVGLDPQADAGVFTLQDFVSAGRLEPGGMLVGRNLAEALALGVGDSAYLTFRDRQGMMTSTELQVTGLVDSANPMVNHSMLFFTLAEAQRLLHMDRVTEIALKTDDETKYPAYGAALRQALPGVRLEDWKQLGEDYAALSAMKRKGQSVFLLFILIIALVGVINTVLMSVYEKKAEIGTLMALGFRARQVRNLFLWEGLLIGVFGGAVGLVLGLLGNLYLALHGFDVTAMMGDGNQNIGFQVMGLVKSEWVWGSYFKVMILAAAASVAASWYPARKVTQMQPMECLRTVQ